MPPPRKKAPPPDLFTPRARGCLWGLCVGDALGGPLKDRRLSAPDFPTLADGIFTEMRGGGILSLAPGQVSAPTQMAACLASSLRELSGFQVEDVRKRYVQWLPVAVGVSAHTQAVLTATPKHLASWAAWQQSSRQAAGAEPLARAVPLAVFFAKKQASLSPTFWPTAPSPTSTPAANWAAPRSRGRWHPR